MAAATTRRERKPRSDLLTPSVGLVSSVDTSTRGSQDDLQANNQRARAVETLAPLVAAAQPDVNALNLSGVARIHLGDFERARELLERALALLPGHPGLLENVALLERKKSGQSPAR